MNVATNFVIQAGVLEFDSDSVFRYHTAATFILTNSFYINGLIQQNEPTEIKEDETSLVTFYIGNATKSESKFLSSQKP